MVARVSDCDRNRLRRLLEGQLTHVAADDATQHVESCDACRRELESLAAEDSWWQDARKYLPGDDDDSYAILIESRGNTVSLRGGEVDTAPDEELMLDFLDPSDNPAMLGRLGGHEILEVIGRGGMGVVLKGYDGELNRYVAIKVLAPHYASSAAARQRFAREAQAAAAVVHQHVVAIHNVDASGKLPYLVMPYVACESLQERLDSRGPLGVKDVLRIGMQTAEGLAAAHAQGLVHRDVKPANMLLEKGVDRVLLTDFGLARTIDDATLTRSGVIAGTPQYMSPEQAKGDSIDHRTDLFSLGSVLYAMCTGRSPFRAETTMGALRRICDEQPRPIREVNPDIPQWLEVVIARMLEKDPGDRYQTASDVAALLEACLAHVQHPMAAELPASLQITKRLNRRRTAYAAIGTVLLAGTILAAAIAGTFFTDSTDEDTAASQANGSSPQTPAPPHIPKALARSDSRETGPINQAAGQPTFGSGPTFTQPSPFDWTDLIEPELFDIESELEWLDQITNF